jgi:uncharacterized protein DUF29
VDIGFQFSLGPAWLPEIGLIELVIAILEQPHRICRDGVAVRNSKRPPIPQSCPTMTACSCPGVNHANDVGRQMQDVIRLNRFRRVRLPIPADPPTKRSLTGCTETSKSKRGAVRVTGCLGGCLGGNRLDPPHDVRFLQQALRPQQLADFHHGAMYHWICNNGAEKGSFELLSFRKILRPFATRLRKREVGARGHCPGRLEHRGDFEHSPAREPRRGWAESVVDARAEIEDLLEASPSLRTELDRDVERQTQRGIDLALRDLGRYQGVDAETIAALRATSYTVAQVLGDWFPEEPRS